MTREKLVELLELEKRRRRMMKVLYTNKDLINEDIELMRAIKIANKTDNDYFEQIFQEKSNDLDAIIIEFFNKTITIDNYFKMLDDVDRYILQSNYRELKTIEQIAEIVNYSTRQVSRMKTKAIDNLLVIINELESK